MRKYAREMAFSMVYAFLITGESEEKLFERNNEETRRLRKEKKESVKIKLMQDLGNQLGVKDYVWLSDEDENGVRKADKGAFLAVSGISEETFNDYIIKEVNAQLEIGRVFLPIDMFDEGNISENDKDFIEKVYYGVCDKLEQYSAALSEYAKGYRVERIFRVDKALLLAAMSEIENVDTPVPVVVNEIVNLAKKFSTEKSTGFINGILGKYVSSVSRPVEEKQEVTLVMGTDEKPESDGDFEEYSFDKDWDKELF